MANKNVFRILGDVSHVISKIILIWAIHSNRSAEGVSLITQMLYAGVFITRYLDLFWVPPGKDMWNFVLKNAYIVSSLYIIFIMMRIYARTREREKAWKVGVLCLTGSALAAPFVMLIFTSKKKWGVTEALWTFSIILESVCVLPQLLLLRQTTVPTVIDSFYLLTLGSYRAFYILNWIVRGIHELPKDSNHKFDWIAPMFGVIQTAFYVDFAWVYWTRQRVKLRNGGVVDSEDLSRGWLVSKIMGRAGSESDGEERVTVDEPNVGARRKYQGSRGGWGARGISVSADDSVGGDRLSRHNNQDRTGLDPSPREDEITGILGNDDEANDSDEEVMPPYHKQNAPLHVVGNGEEWRNGESK